MLDLMIPLAEQDLNTITSIEELQQLRRAAVERLQQIESDSGGRPLGSEQAAEFQAITELVEGDGGIDARIAERQHRLSVVQRLERTGAVEAGADEDDDEEEASASASVIRWEGARRAASPTRRAGRRVPADVFDLSAYRRTTRSDSEYATALRDGAMFAIEQSTFPHPLANEDAIRSDLEAFIGRLDPDDGERNAFCLHVLRTGSPAYNKAFALTVMGLPLGPAELQAMQLSVPGDGGNAVPFQFDPTVIRTSDGAINALRRIARQERVVGDKWRGVTASSVTVRRGLEGQVSVPSQPTLGRPELGTVKVDAFVPFSIELGLAWQSILSELAAIISDAKDEEEAQSFIYGDGVDEEPGGLLGTLPNGSRISVGGSGSNFGPEDLYAIDGAHANALAPRWRARASFLASKGIYNIIRSFADDSDGASLWVRLGEGLPDGLLGYRSEEQSTMPATAAGAPGEEDILVLGDFNQFLIADRVGMTVEVVQHLTQQATAGTGYGVPIGMRGLYAHWHNNARILVPNAFRALTVGSVGS